VSSPERKNKLQKSQLHAVSGDIELRSLNLSLKGYASEWVLEAVVDAYVERTIEGASTFTIQLLDRDRVLMNSPYLASDVYTEIDGLWFALVRVEKSGDFLTLTWEDREVYLLRKYDKPKSAAWGTTTRPKFIREMVREVKEVNIPFRCPELGSVKQPEAELPANITLPSDDKEQEDDKDRKSGFAPGTLITVKNVQADATQKENISRVLNQGIKMKVPKKLLLCAIMTITVESTARALSGGDRDSIGLFQQRPSQGWGDPLEPLRLMIPEYSAELFYNAALKVYKDNPNMPHGELCQAVQRSAHPDRYALWFTEASNTVRKYGLEGDDQTVYNRGPDSKNQEVIATEDGSLFLGGTGADFQFTRGQFTSTIGGGTKIAKREDSWEAAGRLADEVNWRRFVVAGEFYYVSEPYLFRSKPRVLISSEYEPYMLSLDFKYDTGEHNAEVRIRAFTDRWAAPPGSVVMLENLGVINGRWLVNSIRRSLFNPAADIVLKKPRPKLPEPTQEDESLDEAITFTKTTETPSFSSGLVAPLKTDGNLDRSEFAVPDAEGAPSVSGGSYHAAKDWFAPYSGQDNSEVVAPVGGTIVEVKPSRGSSGQIFGGVVKLQQDGGVVWVFRHVDPEDLKVGQRVAQSTVIAHVTKWNDRPASSHCHIEVWKTLEGGYKYENMVDPCKVLKGEI
jgi:hypothetical protein